MIAIEITDVRPFDVLLTSGATKTASVNKLCQSLTRRGRAAPYSHASVFLTPFLIAESLDKPGIMLTDLFALRLVLMGMVIPPLSNNQI